MALSKRQAGVVGGEGRGGEGRWQTLLLLFRKNEVRSWGLNHLAAWLPSGEQKVWQRQPLGGEPELAT